jgi:hypothetical protein
MPGAPMRLRKALLSISIFTFTGDSSAISGYYAIQEYTLPSQVSYRSIKPV